jgi:hypothetical protein
MFTLITTSTADKNLKKLGNQNTVEMTEFLHADDFTALEYESGGTSTSRLPPEKHLDSPVTTGLVERVRELITQSHCVEASSTILDARLLNRHSARHPNAYYSEIKQPCLQFIAWGKRNKIAPDCLPAVLTPKYYPSMFRTSSYHKLSIYSDMTASQLVYQKVVEAYTNELKGVLSPSAIKHASTRLTETARVPARLLPTASAAAFWDRVVELYRKEYTRVRTLNVPRTHRIDHASFMMADGYVVLRLSDEEPWFFATYEQIQMIQDALQARENIYVALAWRLHNGTDKLESLVNDTLDWQELCIQTHGSEGYELVKAPEALYKAHVNSLSGGDILEASSFVRVTEKLRQKEKKLGSDHLVSRLVRTAHTVTTIGDALELFGLIKVSGHPTVYAEVSAKSVRAEAQPYGRISPLSILYMTRIFKHIILSNYISKEAGWPPFEIPPFPNTLLHRHWKSRTTLLPYGCYDLSDLDNIRFGKFQEFDYSEDFLKFLDDKAISPGASQTGTFWYGGRTEPKRLLLAALATTSIDLKATVERLRRREFTLDEMIVELTQKERELKPAARCFCKLALEVRCFFTLLEYNLGEYILDPYVPQQTMTMSSSQTRTRLHQIAVRGANTPTAGFLEIDFSRWNLRWRARTVNPIAWVVEDIFGLPGAYSQVHWFFEHATVVLTDRHNIPTGVTPGTSAHLWPDSELVWRGHRGGFEGIQQKLWTLCTIAMVYMALIGTPMSFVMAGQGDNQIMAIMLHQGVDRRSTFVRILAKLDLYCKSLGHDVKPEECIDSASVVSYSKEFYVHGVHRMYSLKYASRTLRRDDTDIPSLAAEISGSCANASALADTLPAPIRAYLWQIYSVRRVMYFWYRSHDCQALERTYLSNILNSAEVFTHVALLPGSLGGLPVLSYTRYYLKGEVDDLVWDIEACLKLAHAVPSLGATIAYLVNGGDLPPQPDLAQLIADPRSIPIIRPPDQRRLLKEAMRKNLPGSIRNTWLREIISDANLDRGDQLIIALSTMRPLYPQIAQDIFDCSLPGLADRILNRFTMTRTIRQVTSGLNFRQEIRASNSQLLKYVILTRTRSRRGMTRLLLMCSFDIALELRQRWGLGDLQTTIGVYCPLGFALIPGGTRSGITSTSRTPAHQFLTTVGPYPPKFGTRTKQKRSTHGYTIITSSDTVRDLRRLVMTATELASTGNLHTTLDAIVTSRCKWGLTTLERYFPTHVGGTAAHRHENVQSAFFSTLGSCTVPSHLNYDTDHAGILVGGEDDYPIAFEEFFLVLDAHCSFLSWLGSITGPISLTIAIPDNLQTIPAAPPQMEKAYSQWIRANPTNKLAYADTLIFSKFKDTPPLTLIPSCTTPTPTDIVYSQVMTNLRYKPDALTSLRGAIIHVSDLLDIKEATRVSPHQIYLGCAAAVWVHAVAAVQSMSMQSGNIVLEDAIQRLISSIAPSVTKVLFHPSLANQRNIADTDIVMTPGGVPPRRAVSHVIGKVLEYIHHFKTTKNITNLLPRLVLGADKIGQCANHGRRVGLTELACGLSPGRVLLSPWVYRRLCSAESIGRTLGSECDAYEAIQRECHRVRRDFVAANPYHSSRVLPFNRLRIWQNATDQSEIRRLLRSLPKLDNPVQTESWHTAQFARTFATGVVKLIPSPESDNMSGTSSLEACQCRPRSTDERRLETRRGYLWRVAGHPASVQSVWDYVFSFLKIRTQRPLFVGVGHGANITSLLLRVPGINATGMDLRSSFPLISQRELSYVPPQIAAAGLSNRFSWHTHTFNETGGDFFQPLDVLCKDSDLLVVDVETRDADVLEHALTAPCPVLIRVRVCDHQATHFLKLTDVHHALDLTLDDHTERQYILTGQPHGRPGHTTRADMLDKRAFLPVPVRQPKTALLRLQSMIRPFGHMLSNHMRPEIQRVHDLIRTTWTNSMDPTTQSEGKLVCSMLKALLMMMSQTMPDGVRLVCNDLSIPREEARFLILHASNVVPNVLDILAPI